MANEFIARNGLISQNNSIVTGSLTVTQGITGSLFGTSSVSTNITVTDDSSTNAAHYLIFSPSSSGAVRATIDSADLTFNPSLRTLTTGDLSLSYSGNRTLTLQATSVGGTEIKLLPNASSGYARINVGNTTQPLDFQINSVNVMRIAQTGATITGSLNVTSDFFAPIFYDANDTSYYVNPSSISKLFDLTVTSTNGIKAPIYYDSGDTSYYVNPANTSRLFTLDVVQISAGEAMEAPIYYNVGNTSYYVNPSGTSRLFSIMDTPGGISTNAYITAPIYYDSANSAYYVTPANISKLFGLEVFNTLNVSQGITGSLFGSSSYSLTSSFVQNAESASYVLQAISSSYATTASFALNAGGGGSGGTDLGLVQAMTVGLQNIF